VSPGVDFSIIIPAYNEEAWLPDTLRQLKHSLQHINDSPEIIVVDNNSTDRTASIAKENGVMVVKEPIVDIDDGQRRLVWGAIGGALAHYNGAVQVFAEGQGESRVVWTTDFLPNEASGQLGAMIEQGMAVMKKTLDQSVGVRPKAASKP
jgi:GT2 family glycosyltransferase